MSKQICLYSPTLNAEALGALAEKYQAAYGLPAEVRMSAPALTAPTDWPGLLDNENEKVVRYWSAQTQRLSAMLDEALPPTDGTAVQRSVLSLLATDWDDDAQRTVVYDRTFSDHSVAIVFRRMTVDSSGRLRINGAALPLPPLSALVEQQEPASQDGGAASEVQQALWVIMKYIGDGLSDGEPPFIGTIFKVLLDFLKMFTQTSSDKMTQLLADIKNLLQEDRIQIEMDEANAVIETWGQYEGAHFQQADLTTLDQSAPSSPEYKAAAQRVGDFITKINADLNGTPRLFDAVNLMRGDTGENSNLDFPDDAMLKFSYFMFYAGFILALGKQAWMSSKQLNGNNADVTQSLQKEVAYLSTNYTAYVSQLSSSINAQVNTRIGRWSVVDEQPIDQDTFIFIWDNTTNRGAQYYPPSEWGYTGETSFSFCGTSQYNQAIKDCNAALATLITCYQNYMYGRIVKAASDGRTLQQEFNARVSTFQDNDKKYQNLAAKG